MSGELSARSSPSFAASPPGADDARAGEATPLRAEAEGTRPGGGVRLRRRWQRRQQWRVGDTWALDPRARWVRDWNRAYLLACAAGLMVDPLFLYAVSVSGPLMCVFLDGWLAAAVTALRCAVDAMHAWNLLTQLRVARAVARGRRGVADEEQAEVDAAAARSLPAYLRSRRGMALDFFVILPVMQVVVWVAAPAMIRAGSTTAVMTVVLVAFLLEYLPKIYHSVSFLRRTQDQSGHIFGTIWWGIVLNLMAYFVAAHAVGACWYLLGVQRATKCLKEQCLLSGPPGCASGPVACAAPLYYGGAASVAGDRLAWAADAKARSVCLASGDKYQFGAYKWTVMLVANTSRLEKMLLPIFWGLMTLSTTPRSSLVLVWAGSCIGYSWFDLLLGGLDRCLLVSGNPVRKIAKRPDTILVRGVPSRWFAETRISSKASTLVTHTIFSALGKIRTLNISNDDELEEKKDETNKGLISGLNCKVWVQFESYDDFHNAMKALCGRSLEKEGSRLKVNYDVTWDREGFFRNGQYEPAHNKLEERDAPVHGRKKHYTSRIESDHRKRFRD